MANYQGGYPGSRYNDLYDQYPQRRQNPVDQIGPALDTANPRPSYATAAGKTSVNRTGLTPSPAPAGPQTPQAPGTGSPELAGLMHSIQAPVTTTAPAPAATPAPTVAPTAPPPQVPAHLQPLIDAIPGLTQPAPAIDPAAMEATINQVTRANQGASNVAAEQLREQMAGRTGGLVAPGESGLADTALAGIYRQGAAKTADTLGGINTQLAMRQPELNLQRLLAAGNLGEMISSDDLARQKFGYGKEMDALQMLMGLYGAEQGYQQNAWSPYYSGIVNAYGRG